ncbi:iron complex transport system substrate-binding protein [Williamsia sterculiae]|uniref:Iron complex transport system substrate-binding protein n=2 Tax=Williamsia sterculiae TaxID=1344003 RepID=A0A1N7DVJ7_9NOCA|nr:iron complex transport system substrate-binding protein [Williamsia sterculiae]
MTLMMCSIAVAACSPPAEDEDRGDADTRTIAHEYGETVVNGVPKRVASVGLREHDTLLALGVKPVMIHQWYEEYGSGVGPWAVPLLGDDKPVIIPSSASDLNIGEIAAQKPDLIVGTYAAIDKGVYDNLSKIAPTIVRPRDAEDFAVSYAQEATMIGEAVDKKAEAQQLVSKADAAFATAAGEHPEFKGKTAAVGCPLKGGGFGIYTSKDPRGQFLTKLGFTVPREIDDAAGGKYYAEISGEQLDMVNDYDELVIIDDCGESTVQLDEHPIFKTLDIAKRKNFVYPAPASDAVSHNDVLSIPYALERLVPAIARTVRE